MARINQPLPWDINPNGAYVPILVEGKVVGFCRPDFAKRIVDTMNESDKARKALKMACYDLVARSGGGSSEVDSLAEQYLAKAQRPKSGTGAIALLLKDRQEELDLTDDEFAKFCDTFRLSRDELYAIYAGADLDSNQLTPLARILGLSVDDLIDVWKGSD
ncbi:MAG TPA: hypothetical protein IGS53_13840 [Leptolyngbyaceae cyanobacterium M33_DOE_097]|uniref:Uncharacterized protein n=1 Tax=Oscillatoriales cyanobacterium SpSt-418 TaxID=2282169 RepID=A0A7C3KH39_9CYAN|nr:hypothetical protein [Leptolyngbyaceae cyanobacterium M33_DOE_097]